MYTNKCDKNLKEKESMVEPPLGKHSDRVRIWVWKRCKIFIHGYIYLHTACSEIDAATTHPPCDRKEGIIIISR